MKGTRVLDSLSTLRNLYLLYAREREGWLERGPLFERHGGRGQASRQW